jgi:integrase
MRLILLQGARPEEVMRARVEDVAGDHWQIHAGKSKSAKRNLRLVRESKAIMEGRKMAAVDGWLFPGKRGHVKTFQRLHDSVLALCGLKFVIYDLRHTWATRAASRAVPITTIAAILGHANIRTVMKYIHVRQSDIDTGMQMLDSLNEAFDALPKMVN